ncbi:MAG: helix-turn-helix domain-containing protein [Lachnospiraceae bacterium]|nr:helix-turn-helix domain-containing protein [Lachnospiraceae bacterium]
MNSYPVINLQATGENISNLRKKSGLTVKDIQDVFGFSTPQAVYKWQSGKSLPSTDNLLVLSEIFNVTIEDILIVDRVSYDLCA